MKNLKRPELHTFKSGYFGGSLRLSRNDGEAVMLPNVDESPTEPNDPSYFNQRRQIEEFPGLLPNDFNRELNDIKVRRVHPSDSRSNKGEQPLLPNMEE